MRYHERYGAGIDELRLTMPISIRKPDDPVGGNRITLMRFKVPVGVRDPVDRMRRIHELCLDGSPTSRRSSTPMPSRRALNLLPRGVVGSMLKHVDFLASNVPGIDVPGVPGGRARGRVVRLRPDDRRRRSTPHSISYDGTCHVGVNVDTGAIPDHAAMLECLREGFDEVIGLGSTGSDPSEACAPA